MLPFESTGSGVPLVFIHAFPLSHRMWDVNKSVLSKHFRFITVDLPGFGSAPLSGDVSRMDMMAKEVLATLDQQGVKEKFVVAGLSMGGYVMLQLLKMAPERVRGAAFISTRSAADTPEGREKRFKTIEFIQKEGIPPFAEKQVLTLLGATTLKTNPQLVSEVKSMVNGASADAVCAALRGMAERPDMSALLDSLAMPALFVSGQEDVVIPSAEMDAMSKRKSNSNSDYRLIPNAGHLLNLEQPALFNDTFLHFLKRRVL